MKQLWMLSFRVLALAGASCILTLQTRGEEGKPAPAAKPADPFAKWEKEIAGIEAADAKNPPPKGEVLFIGSSTIRMWKSLARDFPEHKVINHGFGGSEIADATHFADRLIFPVKPRVIFLRSGGNDIHNKKSPQQVFADYQKFVETVHAKLPQTEIVYIGLAPTIQRITEVDKGNELMALIKEYTAKNPKLKFVDTADSTPGPDGQPRADLFIADGLHFNDAGYKILAERVRPFLPPAKKEEKAAAEQLEMIGSVLLPAIKEGDPAAEKPGAIVEMLWDKTAKEVTIRYGGKSWEDREALAKELKQLADNQKGSKLYILLRAAPKTPAKEVQAILRVLAQVTKKIAFAVGKE